MPYSRSVHRNEFERRIKQLKAFANAANKGIPTDLRDMVFQCAIFQASASLETYLKLLVESWAQKIRTQSLGDKLPPATRAHFAGRRLAGSFARYSYTSDEADLINAISNETDLWLVLNGAAALPAYFDGRAIHDKVAYPSFKNLKKLLVRLGVQNPAGRLNAELKRDTETLVEAFQSIRTALAHSSLPTITKNDVRDRLDDLMKLVGALDRILYKQVIAHGGATCWA